jgi:hypothetical protein
LLFNGGVQFTVLCVIVIASTFIPRGSFSFNPTEFNDDVLGAGDVEQHREKGVSGRESDDESDLKKDREQQNAPAAA